MWNRVVKVATTSNLLVAIGSCSSWSCWGGGPEVGWWLCEVWGRDLRWWKKHDHLFDKESVNIGYVVVQEERIREDREWQELGFSGVGNIRPSGLD